MNSSKTVTLITVTLMIMLLISPLQAIPTRHKRWTFNSWRLYGRQYTPPTPVHPITESYSPIISADVNQHDQPVDAGNGDDDDSYNTFSDLLQFFQMLDHEQKDDGNKYFEKS